MSSHLRDSFKLYNTYSQAKEPFSPVDLQSNLARIYVCGITPYDTSHMGHALTALTFDTIHRYLEFLGYQVKHVQNLTDIDDDIIKRAKRDGVPYDQLGQSWDKIYRDSLKAINCLPFDSYVPASTKVPEIVQLVQGLVERRVAYKAADNNVYFRAASFKNYSGLSHLNEDEILEKARAAAEDSLVDSPENQAKESVMDFIIWQAARPNEPSWPSPYGEGRPGWHIECSAIGLDQFGPQFEIHGGGADLIFPHHSSEIAQSETYTGKHPLVKYWMHVGMVHLGTEKMSKSLGNLVLVRDVLKNYSPDALRIYLLSIQYRAPLYYEESGVAEAETQVSRFKAALEAEGTKSGPLLAVEPYQTNFFTAMNDDLNTPDALATALTLADAISQSTTTHNLSEAQATLRQMLGLFGLFLAQV